MPLPRERPADRACSADGEELAPTRRLEGSRLKRFYDGGVARERLNKGDFYDLIANRDNQELKKILWTVYWRGGAGVRERIDELLGVATKPEAPQPDPFVLEDVTEFAKLARAGAYLAGDRRVSPKQRTRWRYQFRDLANQSLLALHDEDEETARAGMDALIVLVDLAVDTYRYNYFRSEDPLEAAQFVVCDAARAIWTRMRMLDPMPVFAQRATSQLMRWESEYGWTRFGEGKVAARAVPLAQVLAELLETPDMWDTVAVKYVEALEAPSQDRRLQRSSLRQWHAILSQQLAGSEYEHLMGRL